jgi:bifunctional UDP-N-acetylglucosamine pyrophosphorylase/glucosamine-1-phosphate N-acetyltransferase
MPTQLIILAAGEGTRMLSDRPKVLHEIAGLPLYAHAIASGSAVEPERIVLVVGHGAGAVEADAKARFDDIAIALQAEQLGTAHATAQARAALDGASGDAVVLYGDTPFIRPETLEAMKAARAAGHDLVVLGFEARDPGRYGRLVMSGDRLEKIVEFKDAGPEERAITLCNSGVVMAEVGTLFDLVDAVGTDNAAGEYYLTDIVGIARDKGLKATAVPCPEAETMGINTRAELAEAERIFQNAARSAALAEGVTLTAPDTVHFSHDTWIGRDAVI